MNPKPNRPNLIGETPTRSLQTPTTTAYKLPPLQVYPPLCTLTLTHNPDPNSEPDLNHYCDMNPNANSNPIPNRNSNPKPNQRSSLWYPITGWAPESNEELQTAIKECL